MRLTKILFISGIISFTGSSCNFNTDEKGCAIPITKTTIPIKSLLSAPTTVIVNNEPFILKAYLLPSPMGTIGIKKPECLTASLNITTESNNSKLPSSYKAQRLWYIYNEEAWEINIENSSPQERISAIDGPSVWGFKENGFYNGYYAVIQLKDNQGKSFFIKSENIDLIQF